MNELLIFAGTTEGRKLSECLTASGIMHTVCVATEYGELVLKESPYMNVHCGRMNREEIKDFVTQKNFAAVVDATHPYAEMITENIKTAMQGLDLPYFRLKRAYCDIQADENVVYFETNEQCAQALQETKGNILLTTGSKELSKYCICESVKSRLYVRILPSVESLSLCMEQGIHGKQLIAMQGPFTEEMNEAIIHQYGISCLVTKQSGLSGGYAKKLQAAAKTGISVFVIGHPKEDRGYNLADLCKELERLCGKKIQLQRQMQITLAGIGMGNQNSMTKEVHDAITDADILLGAERMIAPFQAKLDKQPFYQADQIIPYLKDIGEGNIVILFSGDSGFYSGCQSLYHALLEAVAKGQLNASIRIFPGISSVAYLAACVKESYQDAAILSMHGKKLHHLAQKISAIQKTYLLMSGVSDVNCLGNILVKAGLTACEVIAGYELSYDRQQIKKLTPQECCTLQEEGLYTCLVKNPNVIPKRLTHGIADREFVRNQVPMTKEEIREVSICKLRLCENAVVYDIGSGTGSMAVEIAGLSDCIQVYAIEQKESAVELIQQNKEKFQLENIIVTKAKAPEGLNALPKASHAFIGGSGGNLREILQTLYQINPQMRIVLNAISMETICEMKTLLSCYPIKESEIVQLQSSKAKEIGAYHLMQAENPVWIFSFHFDGCDNAELLR